MGGTPHPGAGEGCAASSPEKEQQTQRVMTDYSPHSPSPFSSGVKEVEKIGSEGEPRNSEWVRVSCFKTWVCFLLPYCDLIGSKLN